MKMVIRQNPLTNHWMCYIPGIIDQMYAVPNVAEAIRFVNNVNAAIKRGEIYAVDGEIIVKK